MIKCNKEGCKYMDAHLQPEECVGVNCPECGEVLLSKSDFDMLSDLDGVLDKMRNIPGFKQMEDALLSKLDGGFGNTFNDMLSKMFTSEELVQNNEIIDIGASVADRISDKQPEEVSALDSTEKRKKTRRSKKH